MTLYTFHEDEEGSEYKITTYTIEKYNVAQVPTRSKTYLKTEPQNRVRPKQLNQKRVDGCVIKYVQYKFSFFVCVPSKVYLIEIFSF